jgi:hypothetical protein
MSNVSLVPPAVPSFGLALPDKPPTVQNQTKKLRKKKRKHNQLGLTPMNEDHESSEEEDPDEESKLAAQLASTSAASQQ